MKKYLNKKTIIISIIALIVILVVAFYPSKTPEVADAGWWDDEWLYRMKLTIDDTKIDADLTDFPVLVKLTNSELTFANAQSNGEDIRFTDNQGNLLKYEIERWIAGSSVAEIWVKVPVIESTVETYFYMYYGNATAPSDERPTEVWDDDYVMIQHMNESSGSALDSTDNDNDGTFYGLPDTIAGKIGLAQNFDGDADYIRVAHDSSLSFDDSQSRTQSYWIKTSDKNDTGRTIAKANNYYQYFNSDLFESKIYDGETTGRTYVADTDVIDGTWHMITTVVDRDSDKIYLYIDDEVGDTDEDISDVGDTSGSTDIFIGTQDGGAGKDFTGQIDELTISNTARTAAWIKANYNSMNNTLLTYGSEEKGIGPVLWLKFDEGQGTTAYDSSEQGNDGTLNGTTSTMWTNSGKFGKAIYFDRTDDYVEIADADEVMLDSLTEISFSAWIKPTVLDSTWQAIIHNGGGWSEDGYALSIRGSDGGLRWESSGNACDYTTSLTASVWTHVVATYTVGSQDIYVNGVLVKNCTDTWTITGNSHDTRIGLTNNADSKLPFGGNIDEVKVYPYVRSPEQIKRDYNKGAAVRFGGEYELPSGLVAYWPMDERADDTCSGGTKDVCDTSNNSNDGTINGNPTWQGSSECKYGNCLNFDRDGDYFEVADADEVMLDSLTEVSVSVWIKLAVNDATAQAIIHNGGGWGEDGYALTVRGDTPVLRWEANSDFCDYETLLTAGVWTHIVATYTPGSQNIYVNNELVQSSAHTWTITGNSFDTRIGLTNNVTELPFSGNMDEFMIFNKVLTQKEVSDLYSIGRQEGSAVGHWKFDEGQGTTAYDNTDNDNDGTITNATWTTEGKFGRALDFDGSGDYVTIGDSAVIDASNTQLSVSAWVKTDISGSDRWIIAKYDAPNDQREFALGISPTDKIYFSLQEAAASFDTNNIATGSTTLSTGTWYYVTGVFDSENILRVYVNGLEDGNAASIPTDFTDTNEPIYIGANQAQTTSYFNGLIDEVKIYPYALSEEQVKIDYNNGKAVRIGPSSPTIGKWCPPGFTGNCSAPVGEWKMDEREDDTCTGGTNDVCDTSNNSNDGAITGATWKGSAECKYNNCLDFDGDGDYIDLGQDKFESDNVGSISLWFKSSSKTDNANAGLFMSTEPTEEMVFGLRIIPAGDSIYATVQFYDDDASTNNAFRTTNDIDDTINWHHVVLTSDGSTWKIYLDGTEETLVQVIGSNAGEWFGDMPVGTQETRIGRMEWNGGDNFFNGLIDNAMIFDYALTQEQVAWLYNKGKPVGHWKFNEGENVTAYDSSVNNNSGTLTNMDESDWVTGKYGSALDLDGDDDYVDVGDTSIDVKSVSLWVKPDAINVTEEPLDLDGTGYVKITNGTVTGEGFTSPTIYINGKVGSTVTTGWNHIVITTGTGIDANDVDIGRLNSTYFDGKIDEVKIYNYALTSEQVLLDYNQGSALRFGD